ncbi:hypothetical protein CBR_g41632 [Chara braunii]|uniref:CCHC-type domain-containing protein n=1 Tax=Chara braunii TaxID=69332 RepID=A0A388LW64_CHABU|nr:hypothetical protein CBR_g41632 [Chara braunii]|eukprot:GBG86570.1 hypothetical protein CBR_g41632 [Chara braunii]
MSNLERYNNDRDRRPYKSVVKCFNCNELGHYANQCPHRDRRYNPSRPSTSSDSRRSHSLRRYEARNSYYSPKKEAQLSDQVEKLTKGVVTVKEHFDQVQSKKEWKARRKAEKERAKEKERLRIEEEEARLAQEELRREAKKQKKEEKAKHEAALKAEMKKDITLHSAMLMSEIKDDWIRQWKSSVLPTLVGGGQDVKGKKQVKQEHEDENQTNYSSEESETSVTQELSEKTKCLWTEHDDGVCVDEVVCGLGRGVTDGNKTRGGRSGEDRGGRVVGRWVTDDDKTRGNKGGEDGGDEVRGGEVVEAETGGAVVGETRRGNSAGGNAGMATDAMEEHTETKGDTIDAVVTDAMEEHAETKGDTTAAVATDAMEEHIETKGDTAGVGRVAPAESIVEATKADEEEAANRKGAARVTNGMEGVTKTDEDAGAADAGNEEEAVIGVTGADNEEGAVTGVVRGECVDTRESG